MNGYTIEDAEALSRALSEESGFEIPPAHLRADLYPGDLATLLFNIDGHVPGEPLRVQVLEVEGPGQYIGRLVEESGHLRFGTPVAFDERQVAWVEPPNHPALSGIFDIWKSKGPPPPPPPPPPAPSPGFPASEEPRLPVYPREMERIPQESYPLPEVFYLPYRPTGMIPAEELPLSEFRGEAQPLSQFRPEAAPPSPVKKNPFAIWSPAAKENLPVPMEEKAGAFAIWEKKETLPAPIQEKAKEFSIWTPPPSQAPIVAPPPEEGPGMFSVWNPEVMAAEAEAYKQMDLWEIVVPKSEQGSMYQPEEKEAFDIWQPEPVAPPEPPKKKRKKQPAEEAEEEEAEGDLEAEVEEVLKAVTGWKPPTVKWMAGQLKKVFDLDKLFKMIRKDRKHSDFIESQIEAEETGEGIPIPIQTIVNYEMSGGETLVENLFDFFEIDKGVLEPLFQKYEETEDEEIWETLNEVAETIKDLITQAFETLKPDDIPGYFVITYHDYFGNQEFLGYGEDPADTAPPEERRRRQLERELEERKAEERHQKLLNKLIGSWRPMTWEQAAEFLDVNYGLQNLAQKFRRAKKTKKWQEDIDIYGGGVYIIEDFGEDDGDLEPRVAKFLGVPMSVVDRFADENELSSLWEAVLYPAFESFEEAWENIRPEDLPGDIMATSDEGNGFALYYSEPGEDTDTEEAEEEE